MKAMILAAGLGTRLRPFTRYFPKVLVPVQGIPLILYTLAFLKKNGIKKIVINLHHHGDQIKKLLGNGKPLGLSIHYSSEKKILGTGGGIQKALPYLSEKFFVINGDVMVDGPFKKILSFYQKKVLATLVLRRDFQAKRYGLITAKKGQVVKILDHPRKGKGLFQGMFSGLHVLSKKELTLFLETSFNKKFFCIVRDVYRPFLNEGGFLGAAVFSGFWRVHDKRKDVFLTQRLLKNFKLSYRKDLNAMIAILKKKPLYHRIVACFE